MNTYNITNPELFAILQVLLKNVDLNSVNIKVRFIPGGIIYKITYSFFGDFPTIQDHVNFGDFSKFQYFEWVYSSRSKCTVTLEYRPVL